MSERFSVPRAQHAPEPSAAQTPVLRAGCKINLFLDITGLLPDGRHRLRTLFWPLPEPHDTLRLCPAAPGSGVRLVCAAADVDPVHNTVVRACEAFAAAAGWAPDLRIELTKGIPSGAGLGGGSADAAVVLRWLNHRAPSPLTPPQLTDVAVGVGADVPFFLHNRPALATGVGEVLAPCPEAALYSGLWLVLVFPAVSVNTAQAFQGFDAALRATVADTPDSLFLPHWCLHVLTNAEGQTKNADSPRVNELRNSLEPVAFAMYPELNRLKTVLLRHGAAATAMSGSGSTVFGLFREAGPAQAAAQAVRALGKESGQVWVQLLQTGHTQG